jgi:LPS export ABC transporter protein LptC
MTNGSKQVKHIWAALLMGCFFMCSCENNIKDVENLGKSSPGVEEGKNIESFLSQGGKMKAKLTAPLMLRYLLDTPRVEFPKTMHVDFYDSLITVESQLDSKFGRYFENENRVFLRDSVRVFSRKGDTLWTDELYWDQNKGEFYTDKKVKVRKENDAQYIHSIGMRSNLNFTNITFYNIQSDSYLRYKDSIGQ